MALLNASTTAYCRAAGDRGSRSRFEGAKMNGGFVTLQKEITSGEGLSRIVHKTIEIISVDR